MFSSTCPLPQIWPFRVALPHPILTAGLSAILHTHNRLRGHMARQSTPNSIHCPAGCNFVGFAMEFFHSLPWCLCGGCLVVHLTQLPSCAMTQHGAHPCHQDEDPSHKYSITTTCSCSLHSIGLFNPVYCLACIRPRTIPLDPTAFEPTLQSRKHKQPLVFASMFSAPRRYSRRENSKSVSSSSPRSCDSHLASAHAVPL